MIDVTALISSVLELARVRRRGYALDVEEHAVGLRCAGAAIHDEHGEGLAALSVSGPRARIGARRLAVLGRWVGEAAMAASEALGGAPPGRIRRG